MLDAGNQREGHEFHSCRFSVSRDARLRAAEVPLEAGTLIFRPWPYVEPTLVSDPAEYRYCSAIAGIDLDSRPPAAEAANLQASLRWHE